MKYKGYYGSINFEADDMEFFGKLEFINSLIGLTPSDNRVDIIRNWRTI